MESLEAQAEVAGELAASSSGSSLQLEDKFRLLEGTAAVDAQLAQLKKLLPSPASPASPVPALPAELKTQMDLEYEKLKRDLNLN